MAMLLVAAGPGMRAAASRGMAAKRKYAPPKPSFDRPWHELTKAQQNQLYTKALHAYTTGAGENPGTSGQFARKQRAAAPAPEPAAR